MTLKPNIPLMYSLTLNFSTTSIFYSLLLTLNIYLIHYASVREKPTAYKDTDGNVIS